MFFSWNSSPCNQTTLLFKNLIVSFTASKKEQENYLLPRGKQGPRTALLSSSSSSFPTTELEQEYALIVATCSEIFAKLQVICNYNRYLSDNQRKLGRISG